MDRIANQPHDLSNPYELKDALSTAIQSYMEQHRYWARQSALLDDYDETLENSDFAAWMRRGHDMDGTTGLAAGILESLSQSADLLYQGATQARETLCLLLKIAAMSPPDIQMLVWDTAYDVPAGEMDALLDRMFDELSESGHECGEQDDVSWFLGMFRESIEKRGDSTEW